MAAAAVIGKVLQIVGGMVGTAGQYRNDLAQAQQTRFESLMDIYNANLVGQDKKIVKEAGAQERANISKEELLMRGEGRTAYASGNVAVDEGSALDFDVAAAEQYAAERQASKDMEELAVYKLRNEQLGLLASAQMKRKAYQSQKKSASMGFVGGSLSTIGGAMSMFGGK